MLDPDHALAFLAAAVVLTVVTGLVVWGIRNQAIPHWSFILVATSVSALLMLGWRAIAGRR